MTLGKLRIAPVFYTIGQAKYNSVLNLSNYIPDIQEEFRKAGFPDYSRKIQLQLSLIQAEPAVKPNFVQQEQYQFLDAEGTSGFSLSTDAVSFETTAYDRFGVFTERLQLGLEIVSKAVGGLSYIERLGIRYLDAFVGPTDYLATQLHGLQAAFISGTPGAVPRYSFAESSFEIEGVGEITARSVIKSGPVTFPADLDSVRLKLGERFAKIVGEHVMLDTDAFYATRMHYDLDAANRKMDQLHNLARGAFKAAVTPAAIAAWREGNG